MLIGQSFAIEVLQSFQLEFGMIRYQLPFWTMWSNNVNSLEILLALQGLQLQLYVLQNLVTNLGAFPPSHEWSMCCLLHALQLQYSCYPSPSQLLFQELSKEGLNAFKGSFRTPSLSPLDICTVSQRDYKGHTVSVNAHNKLESSSYDGSSRGPDEAP